uniref:Uncharacterized protein n=1 Tax=Arundo donax TaxID=35708 RepID=A0A0A9A250_ARUDO
MPSSALRVARRDCPQRGSRVARRASLS